jgi:hypothetical protein
MQTVTILCKSDVVPNPIIQDVSVAIYNQASVFVTSGTTNSNGIFSALLPEATYIAYFYKQGLNIVQPITLVVSPISKEFLVYGHLKIAKESLDTNLCCIYGYARDISGKEENEVELIINQIALNIITNSLIFNSPIRVHSDKNGYFEFYLLRNTKYEVHYEGYDGPLYCQTPNLPSLELSNFLFPVPLNLSVSSSININLVDGQTAIDCTLIFTDQNTKDKPYNDWSYLNYTHTNDVCSIGISKNKMILYPQKRGISTTTITRLIDKNYIFTSLPPFVAPILTITVS